MTHKQFSRKGGMARSEAKRKATAESLKKARFVLQKKRLKDSGQKSARTDQQNPTS